MANDQVSIVEMLFKLFFGLFEMVLDLIPTFDLGFDFAVLSPLKNIFSLVNNLIDVKVVLAVISLAIVRDNFTFLKNIFMSVINKIPFLN